MWGVVVRGGQKIEATVHPPGNKLQMMVIQF